MKFTKISNLKFSNFNSNLYFYLTDDIHLASESADRSLGSSSGKKCSVTRVHSRLGDVLLQLDYV